MAYTRGVDVIGKSLMDTLSNLGGDWAQKIARDKLQSQTDPLIQKLFNPSPTVDPNAGAVPVAGTPMTIPIPSVTPGPPPWAASNIPDLIRLGQLNPEAAKTGLAAYQASRPTFSSAAAGTQMFEHPANGGVPFPIGNQVPMRDTSAQTEHLSKQIDPLDKPFKEGGTGKLVQYEYQTSADPTTGVAKYMHNAGYDPAKGKLDLNYEKSQRIIADTKDFSPTGAGRATFQKVTGPMGQITHWVDPSSGKVVTPEDLGITTEAPLSSSTKTMVESAPKVKDFVAKIVPQIDKVKDQLGPAAGRWTEFMAGKVGADNPEYTKLRTNIGLLSTLLMRMHVGARGGEYIMKHFQDLIDQGKQSPDNLKAAIGQINDYADQVLQEGKTGVSTKENDPLGIR